MKNSRQCPKCHSLKVGMMPYTMREITTKVTRQAQERVEGVTIEDVTPWTWDDEAQDEKVPVGLEILICATCGYSELYLRHPKTVELDKLKGFTWLNPAMATEGPYR